MTIVFFLLLLICLVYGQTRPCQSTRTKSLPFCDSNLSFSNRVQDVINRLNFDEKVRLMSYNNTAVPRLDIPFYEWWSEALHGVANSPGVHFHQPTPFATSFPEPSVTGASFSRKLFKQIGKTIAIEGRSMFNENRSNLTFWAPNINIMRDPRWGRNQEVPSEDPFLNGIYAKEFISATQSPNGNYLLVSTCLKHFSAYSLENSDNVTRFAFDARVTERDLNDTYWPAFLAGVRAGASGMMCSYNAVNGVPSCANRVFQQEMVRDRWRFDGYITSDCGAIDTILAYHHYTHSKVATVFAALEAGTDVDCGAFYGLHLPAAYAADPQRTVKLVDRALFNSLMVLMRLGWFDGDKVPFADKRQYGAQNVSTTQHIALARRAAVESITLLRNDNSQLPLSPTQHFQHLAVIGPNANSTSVLEANYYGKPKSVVTVYEAIRRVAVHSVYEKGCEIEGGDRSGFSAACTASHNAQAIILVVGNDEKIAREGKDRTEITLPGFQNDLVEKIEQCSGGKPIVIVIMAGAAIDISRFNRSPFSIINLGYAGQEGGSALADVLFGFKAPAGRLPYTLYHNSFVNQVKMTDMNMRPSHNNPGRTYRFFTGKPVFPFGFGLHYTSFEFKWHTSLPSVLHAKNMTSGKLGQVSCIVTNTGSVQSDVSVLAFVVPPQAHGAPLRQLFAFDREAAVAPGTTRVLTFDIDRSLFVGWHGHDEIVRGTYIFTGPANETKQSNEIRIVVD